MLYIEGLFSLETVYDMLGKCCHSYLIAYAPNDNIHATYVCATDTTYMQHIFVLQTHWPLV